MAFDDIRKDEPERDGKGHGCDRCSRGCYTDGAEIQSARSAHLERSALRWFEVGFWFHGINLGSDTVIHQANASTASGRASL